MTIAVFDLTENTQAAVRLDTGFFDGLSMSLFSAPLNVLDEEDKYDEGTVPKSPFDMCFSDALPWDRAVRFAQWILEIDKEFNPHDEKDPQKNN